MSNNVKLLLILLIISVGSNLYQMREVVNLQDTIKITTAYYQSELARLYDFHLESITDLHEYYRGK